jgi:hypothetical protein
MSTQWPDALVRAEADDVAETLSDFWRTLANLPELLLRSEHVLCAELLAELRASVLAMMLGLNGIARPAATRNLNAYLSERQRAAIEKTLILPEPTREGWIGQAVALVVIYRWYAPQLVEEYGVPYPEQAEQATLGALNAALPEWPRSISTS